MDKDILSKIQYKVANFNPPKKICNHLLGEEHTEAHRMTVGIIIVFIGVIIAESGNGMFFHIIFDGIGYGIHAIGAMPFLEKLEKWRKS